MLPTIKRPKKNIYLDYAATTPLDPMVKKAMAPFFSKKFGNPSSLYEKGREAKEAIEQSRKTIANLIGARPAEIIFTAGGTESVNLAIFGVARNYSPRHHLLSSKIEHHCVINSFKALAGEGYKTSFVGVGRQGQIDMDQLKSSIKPETILISVIYANNEIGTVEPIAEIGKWLKSLNAQRILKKLPKIIFHTDACQAAGYLDLNADALGVDLMSINGSKVSGPKQSGFLYARSGLNLKPLIYGGGQERGLRSGTENVPAIVGFAKALELAQKDRNRENKRLVGLRDYLIKKIKTNTPNVLLNGADDSSLKVSNRSSNATNKLPNITNLTFKGVEGESLMIYLDSYGISVSTASACSTGNLEPSHVLLAIGRSPAEAKSSIRISLGKQTEKKEIDYLLKVLPPLVNQLRQVKNQN